MPFARPETTVNLSSTRLRTSRLVRAQIPQRAFEFRLPRRPGFQRDPTSPGSKAVPPGGPPRAASSVLAGAVDADSKMPDASPGQSVDRFPGEFGGSLVRHEVGGDGTGMLAELVRNPLETSPHFRPESVVPSSCVTGIESRRLKTDPAERYRLTCDCIGLVVAQQDWMMRRGDGRWTSEKRHFRV